MGNKLAKTLQKFLEPLETTDFYIFQSVLFSQQEYNFKIITIILKKGFEYRTTALVMNKCLLRKVRVPRTTH